MQEFHLERQTTQNTLQRPKPFGIWLYLTLNNYFSFHLRFLKICLDPTNQATLGPNEEALIKPIRLQVFSGCKQKSTCLRMGPIIANAVKVWRQANAHLMISFHVHSPFHL